METTFEQFRNCLRSDYARRQLGLVLSKAEADALLTNDALAQEPYAAWLALRPNDASLDAPSPMTEDSGDLERVTSEQTESPEGHRRLRNRLAPIVTAASLVTVVLVASVAVGGLEIGRLSSEVAQLRSTDERVSRDMDAASRGLGQVRETARAAATRIAEEMDIKSTYDQAIGSIVTVHCGDALGSGFAYDVAPGAGYNSVIVTNQHVISDCRWSDGPQVSVETHDGAVPISKLWNFDEKNDLALIMTDAKLDALLEASPAEIGDPVIAIGSPLGFTGSVTSGIVSNVYSDAFQTDAAINHGNSGGPLLDATGRVLGVTTLGLDREGLNIAVRPLMLCKTLIACT